MAIELVMRWMHILGAVVLVGGTMFWRYALLPGQVPESLGSLAEPVRSKWSRLVMLSSGLLLISGLVNFSLIVTRYSILKASFPGNLYHMLFGIKFLLAFALFFLAALLAGRSGAAQKLRKNERLWLSVAVWLAIAIICLGGLMKFAGREPKQAVSRARPDTLPLAVTMPFEQDAAAARGATFGIYRAT